MKMHGLASMVKMMHLNQLYHNPVEGIAPLPTSRYPNSFTAPLDSSSKETMLVPPVIRTASLHHMGAPLYAKFSKSLHAMSHSPESS
jgi:hypothetical protein